MTFSQKLAYFLKNIKSVQQSTFLSDYTVQRVKPSTDFFCPSVAANLAINKNIDPLNKPLYDCKNLRVIDVINWDYADTRPDQKKKRGGYTQKFYEEDRKTKTEKRGKIIKKKRSKPTKK